MSYFDEVYLKRMNLSGTTRQERINQRKINEFNNLFLKNSAYKVDIYKINQENSNLIGSLQPHKWNESNLIANLLLPSSAAALKTGDLLNIKQQIKDRIVDKLWLVIFVEDNITKGYQLFKCLCLDTEINLTDEYGNTFATIPAKISNIPADIIIDEFLLKRSTYREPYQRRGFYTASNDLIKKGQYFNYADKGWEIGGIDDMSIKGVSYVSMDEKLIREEEPTSSQDLLVGEDTNFFLNGR